jgi:uncharacterized protein YbaR (Trm112 family)
MKRKQGTGGLCPEGMDLLLPWHLNHTLEKEEERKIKRHLLSCPICRQELKQIKQEQRLYQSAAEEIPIPQTFPHVISTIEEKKGEGIWQRITSLIPRPRPALVATLIIAQFLVIIGLVALLAFNPWNAGERFYRTLSGPSLVEGKGPRISILFQDGVKEKSMREVILGIDGTIVSGPTALGIYTVELRSQMSTKELQHVIASLRQRKDTIRFVEVKGE